MIQKTVRSGKISLEAFDDGRLMAYGVLPDGRVIATEVTDLRYKACLAGYMIAITEVLNKYELKEKKKHE